MSIVDARHNELLGLPLLKETGRLRLMAYKTARRTLDVGLNYFKRRYGNEAIRLYRSLRARRALPDLRSIHQRGSLLRLADIFSRQAYYSIEKAKARLGFEPRYDFNEGMKLVRQWLLHSSQVQEPAFPHQASRRVAVERGCE